MSPYLYTVRAQPASRRLVTFSVSIYIYTYIYAMYTHVRGANARSAAGKSIVSRARRVYRYICMHTCRRAHFCRLLSIESLTWVEEGVDRNRVLLG